jgi:hypothetical protein
VEGITLLSGATVTWPLAAHFDISSFDEVIGQKEQI